MYILSQIGESSSESLPDRIRAARLNEVGNLIAMQRRSRDRTLETLRRFQQENEAGLELVIRARIAIVALYLNDTSFASAMCQIEDRPNPILRTEFISQLFAWHADPLELARIVGSSNDVGLQSAVCLGLEGMTHDASVTAKAAWSPILTKWWETAPDCVTQSSAERALLLFRQDATIKDSMRQMDGSRDWYFNSVDMKLARIPPRHAGKVIPIQSTTGPQTEF